MPGDDSAVITLPARWELAPFDPDTDEAPHGGEHDCDGGPDNDPALRGATSTPASRGWGPGWPDCQYDKWVTIVRRDGMRISTRREISELNALLLDETERLGYDLIPGQCWGSACRSIRGSSTPSNHSWGLADDLNAPENPMGTRNGKIRQHPKVIALWERFGWRSGTKYSGRPDDMHMEFMGTPGDARLFTAQARLEFGSEGFLMALNEAQQNEIYERITALSAEQWSKLYERVKSNNAMLHALKNASTDQELGRIVRDILDKVSD